MLGMTQFVAQERKILQLRNAELLPQGHSIVKPTAVACESRAGKYLLLGLPLLLHVIGNFLISLFQELTCLLISPKW